jgi:hypothetical protein
MKKHHKVRFEPVSVLCLRAFLFFAALSSLSVEVSAQDTVSARVPQVELVPVHQRDVMGHYINRKYGAGGGVALELFDGQKTRNLDFDVHTTINISPNQQYFTVAKPIPKIQNLTDQYDVIINKIAYDVELRNISNTVLAKGRFPTMFSEEANDWFIPADDGSGLIQWKDGTFGGLRFILFQRKEGGFQQLFEVDKPKASNGKLAYEPDQKMLLITYESVLAHENHAAFVQCYAPDGTVKWENSLDSIYINSDLFISPFDGTVAFVSRSIVPKQPQSLWLFEKKGNLIQKQPVYHGGVYQRSYYCKVNDRQYFISPSDGPIYYVIDTESGEIVNRNTTGKEGSNVFGVAMLPQMIVTSYFIRDASRRGPNNGDLVPFLENGLSIEDEHGIVSYVPLNLNGYPFLVVTEFGLFLRVQNGSSQNKNDEFFKVKQ